MRTVQAVAGSWRCLRTGDGVGQLLPLPLRHRRHIPVEHVVLRESPDTGSGIGQFVPQPLHLGVRINKLSPYFSDILRPLVGAALIAAPTTCPIARPRIMRTTAVNHRVPGSLEGVELVGGCVGLAAHALNPAVMASIPMLTA